MAVFLEILKYAVPAILVVFVTYLMLSNYFDNEEKQRKYLLKRENQKSSLPLRMAAYERMVLFLERISPNSLLVRIPAGKLGLRDYQSLLQKSIRDEFEHNLSQQVYLSDEAWLRVVQAKASMVGIINKIASEIDPSVPGLELSKRVLEYSMSTEEFPTKRAIHFLKAELRDEL